MPHTLGKPIAAIDDLACCNLVRRCCFRPGEEAVYPSTQRDSEWLRCLDKTTGACSRRLELFRASLAATSARGSRLLAHCSKRVTSCRCRSMNWCVPLHILWPEALPG